jgi:hypothetical protein
MKYLTIEQHRQKINNLKEAESMLLNVLSNIV